MFLLLHFHDGKVFYKSQSREGDAKKHYFNDKRSKTPKVFVVPYLIHVDTKEHDIVKVTPSKILSLQNLLPIKTSLESRDLHWCEPMTFTWGLGTCDCFIH